MGNLINTLMNAAKTRLSQYRLIGEKILRVFLTIFLYCIISIILFLIFAGVISQEGIHNILNVYIVINTGLLAIIFAVVSLKPITEGNSNENQVINKRQLFGAFLIILTISVCLCTYFVSYIQPSSLDNMTVNLASSHLFYAAAYTDYNVTTQAQWYASILSPIVSNICIITNFLFLASTVFTMMVIFIMYLLIRSILKLPQNDDIVKKV